MYKPMAAKAASLQPNIQKSLLLQFQLINNNSVKKGGAKNILRQPLGCFFLQL